MFSHLWTKLFMRKYFLVVWHLRLVLGVCDLGPPLRTLWYRHVACNNLSSSRGVVGSCPSQTEEVAELTLLIQVIKRVLKELKASSYNVLPGAIEILIILFNSILPWTVSLLPVNVSWWFLIYDKKQLVHQGEGGKPSSILLGNR